MHLEPNIFRPYPNVWLESAKNVAESEPLSTQPSEPPIPITVPN